MHLLCVPFAFVRYGQMPILEVHGEPMYQSGAILRFVGAMCGDGSLYPTGDPRATLKIEEMIGLADDLQRAWMPGQSIGINPAYLGYPADWAADAKDDKVRELRTKFLGTDLPLYCKYIENQLVETKAFIAGQTPTIADCQLFCQLSYFTRGVADHVPSNILDKYPTIVEYLMRFKAIPAVKEHYGASDPQPATD